MKKILYTDIGPSGTQYKKGEWEQFAIHNDKEVKGFFGPYRFLSNFWPAKVFLDDVEYSSVELAYQSAKWKPEHREYFQTCSELESIKYNMKNILHYTESPPESNVPIRANGTIEQNEWRAKRLGIMTDLITQKFDPRLNPENYKLLLDTDEKHLEEMNWWNDLYWGTNKEGEGENNLGKLLMSIRNNLI